MDQNDILLRIFCGTDYTELYDRVHRDLMRIIRENDGKRIEIILDYELPTHAYIDEIVRMLPNHEEISLYILNDPLRERKIGNSKSRDWVHHFSIHYGKEIYTICTQVEGYEWVKAEAPILNDNRILKLFSRKFELLRLKSTEINRHDIPGSLRSLNTQWERIEPKQIEYIESMLARA